MTNTIRGLVLLCALASLPNPPVWAHHSAAQYDGRKRVSYSGTVFKYEWQNPHAWIWLMVPQNDGTMQKVGIECAAPAALRRAGMEWDSVKVGDKVTITAAPLRNGAPAGLLVSINWTDGRKWVSPYQSVLAEPK